MKVKLYIEGGGNSPVEDTLFRKGWEDFFKKAGLKGRMPSTFSGGGRGQTFKAFCLALKKKKPNELPILLVDSEDLVQEGHSAWQHLKARTSDNWDKPDQAGEDDAFLMICCMETWFLADRTALQKFFGSEWKESKVPNWTDLEKVDKRKVFDTLDKATTGSYKKGKESFKLQGTINPSEVEKKCDGAKRLLDRLRKM